MALALADNPNPTSIRDAFGEEPGKPQVANPENDVEKFRKMVREFLDTSTAQTARQKSQTCRDYYDGKQWTLEEQSKLKQRGQPPIVFNRIKRKVDSVLGVERRQRTDPKAFGRTPDREHSAEIATQALRFVSDQTRLNNSFSACFESGMVEGVGAAEVIVRKNDDGEFDIEVNPFSWDVFIYDVRSRRHDFDDARYKGALQWMDTEDAAALIEAYLPPEKAGPKVEELKRDASGKERAFVVDDTTRDKPNQAGWIDSRNGRVQVCQIYYKKGREWWFGVVAGQTLVVDELSYYKDPKGKTCCPIEAFSAYIDRDLARYGIVSDMLGPQDEINHRRSKAVHFLHSRRVVARTGAVQDVDQAKNEIARPDGFLLLDDPEGFQVLSTAEETQGNLNMLQEAKNEIDQLGPNNALQGKNTESQSGRAILAQQQAGMAELAPLYDRFNDFKLRIYRAIWSRIKQFWTAPKWIRVTDDPESPQWVGLNQPVMQPMMGHNGGPVMDATGQPAMEQVIKNNVAEIDVDIIIDVSADTVTLQGEEFEQIGEVLSKGAGLPPPLLASYIEASNLPTNRKKKMVQALTGEGAEASPEQQQEMMKQKQVAEQAVMLEMDAKAAANEKTRAETQKLLTPEPPKMPEPPDQLEIMKVQGDFAIKQGQLEIQRAALAQKDRELALGEAELSLKAQEIASNERIEAARLADAQAAREQEMARAAMEMQHRDAMAMQAREPQEAGEGAEYGGKPDKPDRGMEAVGMGLQAIAEVMGRPKQVQRGPNGEVTGIG